MTRPGARPFHRRAFLRGAGGALVGLPLLASARARAEEPLHPKRFLVLFRPNGTHPDVWFPTPGASEHDFALGRIHEPLAAWKSELVFLRGLNMDVCGLGPGEQHQQGMGALLTGRELQQGDFVGGDGSLAGWANGISVDQEMAERLRGATRFASLQLGVRTLGSEVRHRLSYQGPGRPLPPLTSPAQLFDLLFSSARPNVEGASRARRRSVLDAVQESFRELRPRLSEYDRERLEAHRAMVRELERRLDTDLVVGGACALPERPPTLDFDHESAMGETTRLQMDLLVMALACDQTRVASLQFSSGANNIRFPFLDSYTDDHQLSHAGPSDASSKEEWILRQRWYMEQLAYLLSRLASVPEGAGTLLDNTLIFFGSELAVGNTHSHRNMPFILAGRAGGALRTGRYLQYHDRQHNDLLVSFLQLMGFEHTTFGHPSFCTGPLPGLT